MKFIQKLESSGNNENGKLHQTLMMLLISEKQFDISQASSFNMIY